MHEIIDMKHLTQGCTLLFAQSNLLFVCIYRDVIVKLGGWVGGHWSLNSSSQPIPPCLLSAAQQAFIGIVLIPAFPGLHTSLDSPQHQAQPLMLIRVCGLVEPGPERRS